MIPPIKPTFITNAARKIKKTTDFVSIKASKKGLDKIAASATKNTQELTGLSKAYDVLTDKIAFMIGKIAPTKPADSIIKGLQHFKKPTPRMADLASIIYTIKLMTDTSKSKKIEKERKPALIINSALVTIASSSLAMMVDSITDPIIKEMGNRYAKLDPATFKKAEASIKSQTKQAGEWLSNADFAKGLSKFKSLSIFTFLVRILVPILSIPITGKITEWFVNRGKEKQEEGKKEIAKA